MDKTEWMITENYWDYKVEKMLFTYDENEIQENKINKNNANLILKPKYVSTDVVGLRWLWLNSNDKLIYWFIEFFLEYNEIFYCTNEQLSELFEISENTVWNSISKLEWAWLIKTHYKIRAWWWKIRFISLTHKNYVSTTHKNCVSETQNLCNIYNNIIYNNNTKNQNQEQSQDTNVSFPKQKDSNTHTKTSELDIIKNSDDIRDIFDDDEIAQHKIQLKIILKMVELWYKVKKSKSDIEKEFERLKAKAKLYWLIQWDWNIARTTFYQKIDKRFDWHTEKWKKVKNFKTSIIPFISK